MIAGCYWHFRCATHAVDGHFEMRSGFEKQCEVVGCRNKAHCYWYRGAKFATLPEPVIRLDHFDYEALE